MDSDSAMAAIAQPSPGPQPDAMGLGDEEPPKTSQPAGGTTLNGVTSPSAHAEQQLLSGAAGRAPSSAAAAPPDTEMAIAEEQPMQSSHSAGQHSSEADGVWL